MQDDSQATAGGAAESYTRRPGGSIVRGSDGAFIPPDPANSDYRDYLDWTVCGGVASEAIDPAPRAPLEFLAFMSLFTPAEQAALVASADTQVKLFLLQASGAGAIALEDPRIGAALGYLTRQGLLAADRAAAILANTPP